MSSSGFKMHRSASELQVYSRFELGDPIGTGGFSTVYKARDVQTGDAVAVKVIDKGRYSAKDSTLQREIDIMIQLEHPHIIKLRTVFVTEASVFMVLDFAPGGELLSRIGRQIRFPERQAAYLMSQILSAIVYLHKRNVVHRDVKLENILLTHRKGLDIKLADFGLSKCFEHEPLQTMCGSPQYVSPEVLNMVDQRNGKVPAKAYTPAVDVWSAGVVLFMLLSGYSPFDDEEDVNVFRKIRHGQCDVDDPIWQRISSPAKDLVAGMLMVNPRKRLTAQQALDHPWLQYFRNQEGQSPRQPPAEAVISGRAKNTSPSQSTPAHDIHASSSEKRQPEAQTGEPAAEGAAPESARHQADESEKGEKKSSTGVGLVKAALGKLRLG